MCMLWSPGSPVLEDLRQKSNLKAFAHCYFTGADVAQTASRLLRDEEWALGLGAEKGLTEARCADCNVHPAVVLFEVSQPPRNRSAWQWCSHTEPESK